MIFYCNRNAACFILSNKAINGMNLSIVFNGSAICCNYYFILRIAVYN